NSWLGRPLLASGDEDGLMHRTDLMVGIIVLAICVFFYAVTFGFDEVSVMLSQNVPPEFYPRSVLIIIMLLALGLPFEHVVHKRRGESIDSERVERVKRLPYLTAGLFLVLISAMPVIGTLLSTVGVCLALPVLWGARRWRLIIPFAIIFPLAVAYVFDRILLVQYEPGMLGITL
ncbi:MAG TPA: tripartite tricarboxylate transporter TctB family protein, partial [Afifellaceae bacterium]|nr:tripartite tricarboxylate transporter TctB family protein [Afifellaceae bacterium]